MHRPTKNLSRWLSSCIVAVISGAVLTLAVSLWCAFHATATSGREESIYFHRDGEVIAMKICEDGGKSITYWETLDIRLRAQLHEYSTLPNFGFVSECSPPAWSIARTFPHAQLMPSAGATRVTGAGEVAVGWPFRALRCAQLRIANALPLQHSPILGRFPTREIGEPVISLEEAPIPAGPIWSGLLLNTAIYGMATFLLTLLLSRARAARRRRRGLCPLCAYNLAATLPGTPCPECGHPPR